jgi:hypothetical protein
MRENDSCWKVIYMGNVQGPEKVNYTCMKTVHAGTIDRGFTVLNYESVKTFSSSLVNFLLKVRFCVHHGEYF